MSRVQLRWRVCSRIADALPLRASQVLWRRSKTYREWWGPLSPTEDDGKYGDWRDRVAS